MLACQHKSRESRLTSQRIKCASTYAEEQRLEGNGPFTATALWLRVDASLTMSDLADRLLGSLGKFIPNFDDLPPQNQALALINAMGTRSEPRLVFVDQFENFFKWG